MGKSRKVKKTTMSNVGVDIYKDLYNNKVEKKGLLSYFKSKTDYKSFCNKFDKYLSHPIAKNYILGGALPSSYEEIRSGKLLSYTDNLMGEYAWNVFAVKKYVFEVEQFISLKQKYEDAFLLQDLDYAELLLSQIEENICKSLWSLENRFLVAEYKYGVEGNWELYSKLAQEIKEPIVLFFIENFSKKAESGISYYRYKNLFENQLGGGRIQVSFKEYLEYRFNYPLYDKYKSFSFFLTMESISSVLDRYLLLRDLILEIISGGDDLQIDIIKEILVDLQSVIKSDVVLKHINNYLFPNQFLFIDGSAELLGVIDIYVCGKYEECVEKIPSFIRAHPAVIEFYDLYVKSLLELGQEFVATGVSSFIDTILKNLYKLYSRSIDSDDAIDNLLKIIITFYSSNWAKQLFGIVSHLVNINPNRLSIKLLYTTYSKISNPGVFDLYEKNNLLEVIKKFNLEFIDSNAVCINEYINTEKIESIISCMDVSVIKKSLYIGRAMLKGGKYKDAVTHYSELLDCNDLSVLAYEEIINNLCVCYIYLSEYKKAIILFVDNYLKNQYFVYRFDKNALREALNKIYCFGVGDVIDLPIFYMITSVDPYEQYVAYDIFITGQGFQKPTQFFSVSSDYSLEKYVFFLKEVCTSEVLHHSIYFEGVDDIENERSMILKELLRVDPGCEPIYIKELTEISQRLSIRNAIREVNKGRIYVNTQQLKNIESLNIKEGFNRYKEIENYSKNKDLFAIDSSSDIIHNYLTLLVEDRQKQVSQIDDPAFISFKVMFLELRDKFIHSKEYGLDGCLSTRIRHGTLENYIRSIFGSLNLVSQKDKNGKYYDIIYWESRIPENLYCKRVEIQGCLKAFSRKVDDFIAYIVKELIQVYTEKHTTKPEALFNYAFTNEYLKIVFIDVQKNISDHNKFLEYTFRALESVTQINLEKAQKIFKGKIKDTFLGYISELLADIRKIIYDNSFADLTTSIVKCRTDVQNELDDIAEWFKLSSPSTDYTLPLKTVIQTSVEITNTINPKSQLYPVIDVDDKIYFYQSIHLIYIIRNLLDNIIMHSGLNGDDLQVKIMSELIGSSVLRLSFENNISESVDVEYLRNVLSKTREKWCCDKGGLDKINIEGGSGFDKIRRILLFDINCKKPGFNYLLSDNGLSIIIDLDIKIYDH